MKTWIIFLFFLTAGSNALADEVYRGIYQVTPHFKGFDKEYAEIKPFYEKMLADVRKLDKTFPREKPPTDREILGIDTFDLNDSGIKEIFVWIQDRAICGANVCPLDVYEMESSTRLCVIYNGFPHGGPLILASITNGYHDLAFYSWGNGKKFYLIWRFNGAQYIFFKRAPIDQVRGIIQKE